MLIFVTKDTERGKIMKDKLIKQASQWRQSNGYAGKNGVVVFFNDELQGWVNELRNPEHWQPGCIAVNEHGDLFESIGGDQYTGANHWTPIPTTKIKTPTDRTVLITTTVARWIHNQGGDRIAQENAAIAAKRALKQGKSAASAIDAGYKSGIKTHNNALLRLQAI